MLPCWKVDVRHERNNGRLGHFESRPITLTEAWKLERKYRATGTPVSIVCLEDLVTLHKAIIRGQLSEKEARLQAIRLGYDIARI